MILLTILRSILILASVRLSTGFTSFRLGVKVKADGLRNELSKVSLGLRPRLRLLLTPRDSVVALLARGASRVGGLRQGVQLKLIGYDRGM
jgi:hypothetical protein